MKKPRYAVGIDLGTTNSVLAYVPLEGGGEGAKVEVLAVPQWVARGTVESRPWLPSFLYLPTANEVEAGTYEGSGGQAGGWVAGHWARQQSAEVPTRTVAAAKSWLAHSGVDRQERILPWNAPAEVGKVSPVEASRRYLAHLVWAWDERFPGARLAEQRVVLTVPASFDERARELTHEAALAAGLPKDLVLLEEPQAAVYAWLAASGDRWRRRLGAGDRLLVCDVGGGTTDFTLVAVEEEGGDLALHRQAVGNHILVGGDNMDLALAHVARGLLAERGVEVDAWQAVSLWHACRGAKESLLSTGEPGRYPLTVLGRGSRLVGGTISVELDGEQARAVLLEGFFGRCAVTDRPVRQRVSGFRELGLPYESEPSITKHLARFLSVHGGEAGPVRPTHVLFNGGVFKAASIRRRVGEVLASWFGEGAAPRVLEGSDDYDFAVARGAAYYGLVKEGGRAIRIRGGVGRSYYVGIESAGLAVPGMERPLRGLCVVPFGMEEGTESEVPGEAIGLVVGERARFRLFSSTVRKGDAVGALVEVRPGVELEETDGLEAMLPAVPGVEEEVVPVRFRSHVTELGFLELWCARVGSGDRWKLEYRVRSAEVDD